MVFAYWMQNWVANHMTKMVWGNNKHIGCATQRCNGFYFTSCLYRNQLIPSNRVEVEEWSENSVRRFEDGLEDNMSKTQVMVSRAMKLAREAPETEESYAHLGGKLNVTNDIASKINRRKRATWATFGREVIYWPEAFGLRPRYSRHRCCQRYHQILTREQDNH
ncbi:hypothetical protein TELCIR_16002 [Teladorsagia circumcincta]|uniref:SCP domain-containing protein n=1 Tax=Teladorsagia circumcincta TaxID=45464 RepID=A0A2G9TWZ0_TELCI|nr:hypothetical protein TELCIR_16002 [Teladorsagia circumcincta]